jgi:hypothetical protein
LSVALLSACSSNTAWRVSAGSPPSDALVSVHTSGNVVAIFGLAILAGGIYEVTRGGSAYVSTDRRAPEMAPDRRVSEQDCTKPLDYSLGNIRCE